MVMGAFMLASFSSLALAQEGKLLQDAHKMMSDGWKMYNDGERMVMKAKEMNDLVPVQMGFQDRMVQGNKIIQEGRDRQTQAATLFAQGDKNFMDNLTNPRGAKQDLKMMSDAFKMANYGGKMIGEGLRMNNQVAQAAGAIEQFAQGNQMIETRMNTMAQGAQLFMQGENSSLQQ